MGTNFYWKELPKELKELMTPENKDILMHIGKRSSAGLYCKECGISLCEHGIQYVHGSSYDDEWYDKCPLCGGEGQHCCSFTWTFLKQKTILKEYIAVQEPIIVNEYYEEFTAREFFDKELSSVIIEFQAYCWFC